MVKKLISRVLLVAFTLASAAAFAGTPKFSIWKSKADNQWYWNLKGGNGEIVAKSEGYKGKGNAKKGIASFRKNGLSKANYKLRRDAEKKWYWVVKAANNRIVSGGESYAKKFNAQRGRDACIAILAAMSKTP